jgi:hypothetical protein
MAKDDGLIQWASPDWHQTRAESSPPDPEAQIEAAARYVKSRYGQAGCDLCQGLGHIVEIQRVVGPRIEVEIRPFDADTEQRPDEGEVWVCPNCFWAVQGTADPLRSSEHKLAGW